MVAACVRGLSLGRVEEDPLGEARKPEELIGVESRLLSWDEYGE